MDVVIFQFYFLELFFRNACNARVFNDTVDLSLLLLLLYVHGIVEIISIILFFDNLIGDFLSLRILCILSGLFLFEQIKKASLIYKLKMSKIIEKENIFVLNN